MYQNGPAMDVCTLRRSVARVNLEGRAENTDAQMGATIWHLWA